MDLSLATPEKIQSNKQAEHFVDPFKRALKKLEGEEADEIMLKQFLSIFRIMLNLNTVPGMSSPELMFTRKIKPVFNKLR